MDRFVRLIGTALCVFVLGLGLSHAQSTPGTMPTNVVPISQYVRGPGTASGISTIANLEMTAANGETAFTMAKFMTGAKTVGRLAGSALGKATIAYNAYFLTKLVVEGAGWAINELTNEVTTKGADGETFASGQEVWCINRYAFNGGDVNKKACWSTAALSRQGVAAAFYAGNPGCPMNPAPDFSSDGVISVSSACGSTSIRRAYYDNGLVMSSGSAVPRVPVSPEDLGAAMMAHPDAVNATMVDPDGRPILTPELVAAMNAANAAYAAKNGQPAPTPVAVPGDDEEPQASQEESKLPLFCSWAKRVCDWLDWTQQEPENGHEDVPEVQMPVASDWGSGLPADSGCPAPVTTSVGIGGVSQQVEFSYQPLCDLAERVRALIIALGLLIAAYIIGGARTARV